METTRTVAKINDVAILLIEDGEKYVPIRPICQALGIDEDTQRRKIIADEILSSVATLRVATGNDGKQYEMNCLPFMYVFGWLFTINPKNVKPEAQESVSRYRMECYTTLFKHFTDQSDFLEQKQVALKKQIDEVERIRSDFKNAKQKLDEARRMLNHVKEMTYDEWQANNRQLIIEFPTHENAEFTEVD